VRPRTARKSKVKAASAPDVVDEIGIDAVTAVE
jgi:hypothetical protein